MEELAILILCKERVEWQQKPGKTTIRTVTCLKCMTSSEEQK